MKKLSLLLLGVLALASCGDDDEVNQIQISNEEAVSTIASSIGSDQGGLIMIFTDAINVINEATASNTGGRQIAECGASDLITYSYSSQQGETPSYSFNYDYGWTLTCNEASQPSLLEIAVNYDGNIASPDFSMDYLGDSDISASGIMDAIVVFNGLYTQDLSYDISNEGQQYNGTYKLVYTLANINIIKESNTIESGSATIFLSGTTNQGAFSISASITYNGDGTANVEIRGESYLVDLATGSMIG
jgi:hypothetical protein